MCIVLSFLPYVAIPLGSNSNLAVCSIVSALLWAISKRDRFLDLTLIFLIGAPVISSFAAMLAGGMQVNIRATIVSAGCMLPFVGMAISIKALGRRAVAVLAVSVLASSIFAIIQKFAFLDRGAIPLLSYYRVPGFASVNDQASIIATYVRRPFGLFPEPSFMAGTLLLASVAILILRGVYASESPRLSVLSVVVAMATIALSQSGSAVFALGLLAGIYIMPRLASSKWVAVVWPVLIAGCVWVGLKVIAERQSHFNYSWGDRASSIIGGYRILMDGAESVMFGIGRGMATRYFVEGRVPLDGLFIYGPMRDVASVFGRLIVECGLVVGLGVLAVLLLLLWRGSKIALGAAAAACVISAWLVVGGLTTSYDYVSWIWALPGLAYAISQRHSRKESRLVGNGVVV